MNWWNASLSLSITIRLLLLLFTCRRHWTAVIPNILQFINTTTCLYHSSSMTWCFSFSVWLIHVFQSGIFSHLSPEKKYTKTKIILLPSSEWYSLTSKDFFFLDWLNDSLDWKATKAPAIPGLTPGPLIESRIFHFTVYKSYHPVASLRLHCVNDQWHSHPLAQKSPV